MQAKPKNKGSSARKMIQKKTDFSNKMNRGKGGGANRIPKASEMMPLLLSGFDLS